MVAVKGIFENGKITFAEPLPALARDGKPHEVTILFDAADGDAKWEALLSHPRPRPELTRRGEEALRLLREGKTTPMDFDQP